MITMPATECAGCLRDYFAKLAAEKSQTTFTVDSNGVCEQNSPSDESYHLMALMLATA